MEKQAKSKEAHFQFYIKKKKKNEDKELSSQSLDIVLKTTYLLY